MSVRGEDIPFLVDTFSGKAVGVTGYDLYLEYVLKNTNSNINVDRTIVWDDENALFRKPYLCLLGKSGTILKDGDKVLVNRKYENIFDGYVNKKGIKVRKIILNGSLEPTFCMGLSDFIVDIVYSGRSIKEYGLVVIEKIIGSDIVVLGWKG